MINIPMDAGLPTGRPDLTMPLVDRSPQDQQHFIKWGLTRVVGFSPNIYALCLMIAILERAVSRHISSIGDVLFRGGGPYEHASFVS